MQERNVYVLNAVNSISEKEITKCFVQVSQDLIQNRERSIKKRVE